MTDSRPKASDSARPLLLLATLAAVCGAALAAVEILTPGSNPIRWTWWLYGIGGIVIFLLLSRKREQRDGDVHPVDQDVESQETAENQASLAAVRRSIRSRKKEKKEE